MSEVFIPPAGAHQFEFTKGPLNGISGRETFPGMAPRRPEWVWVGEPEANRGGCKCKVVYPVLIDGLPDDIRRFALKSMKQMTGYAVECACRGKIIE